MSKSSKGKIKTKDHIKNIIKGKIKFHKNNPDFQTGKNNPVYGKKSVYNLKLKKNIYISKSEVELYLKNGWKLGRKYKW